MILFTKFPLKTTVLFFSILLMQISSLIAVPDLTIVGFINAEDGLGKIPITIIETLGDEISVNLISDIKPSEDIPARTLAALNHPDQRPGHVALFTEGLWWTGRKNADAMPRESIVKLAYSMLESTKIPTMWVKILNEEFDAVVVPDPFLVKVYANSGVKIPIFVLPIPMNLKPYLRHPIHPKTPSTPFVFGDASANKNPRVLIEAFAQAFGNNPNVHLDMRAVNLSRETRHIVHDLKKRHGLTNVSLEGGGLSLHPFIDRLFSFDCYINLSRGEGYSFIPREALALGIPVIITNNTASKTICDSGCVVAVPSNKKGPSNGIYQQLFKEDCGEQFDCEVQDVVKALKKVYENYPKWIAKARKGRQWVKQYDSANPQLKTLYQALIKPRTVILGLENKVLPGTLVTNSQKLYEKYQKIAKSSCVEFLISPEAFPQCINRR